MGILDTLAKGTAAATSNKPATGNSEGKPDRKPSQIWVNVGATLEGAGQDGENLFVSLPSGIPLDDMRPVKVTGSNQHSIQLKQVKNALLDELQKLGASMEPGERRVVPLSVEIYRVANPAQIGTSDTNPLMAALARQLGDSED